MAYSKTNWQNGVTPINETNLNKIENELETLDTTKQDTLVSGTNIKTIDGNSILGSGNLSIIESGNNNVARYIKFDDGTMIQYGYYTLKAVDSRSAGGLTYYSGSENIVLPGNFINMYFSVLANVALANMNLFCQAYGSPYDRDKFVLAFTSTTQNEERMITFCCVGRWK